MLRLDWNLVFTIINVIVLYLLLKKFLFKPVLSIMEKREQMIQGSIASARNQEGQAQELKEQYEQALASAKDESAQIVEKARVNARKEYERIVADADAEAKKLVAQAKKDVELDKEKARQEVQTEVAGLAMAAVSRIIGENSSAGSDSALYNQFLKKAGEANDTDRH